MAKKIKQSIHNDNVNDFVNDLQTLLNKYDLHDKGAVTLTSSNLNFRATNMRNCPPECRHVVEFCDIHHQNCTIKIECDC
jgi:hypothetical protein